MKEKTSVLASALISMNQRGFTWQRMEQEGQTHNLKRIADGEIEVTAKTWWRLHQAYPKHIPSVIFEDKGKEYVVASGASQVGVNLKGSTMIYNGEALSDTESAIIKMIRKRGDDYAEKGMAFILTDNK